MKFSIYQAEWWPVYTLQPAENSTEDVDVSPDLLERYNKAAEEFITVQRLLGNSTLIDDAGTTAAPCAVRIGHMIEL